MDMKRDFKKDLTKKRDDSPLRWISTVHCNTTHDQRVRWLLMENRRMYSEIITADLFLAIARLKHTGKQKVSTNLKEFKAIKEAEELWKSCLEEENKIMDLELQNWRHTERYQKDTELYFGVGEEEE